LLFINHPSFSPITCSINANNITTVRKPDGQYAFANTSPAVIPVFFGAMGNVFRDDTVRIKKSLLCSQERNTVFARFSLSFSSSHSTVAFLMSKLY